MSNKENLLGYMKNGSHMKIPLMVTKIIFKDADKVVCILADKSGEIKANIPSKKSDIVVGKVLEIEGVKDGTLDVKRYKILSNYKASDFLPSVKTSIEDIMQEIEAVTKQYILSKEAKNLNDYFFQDEKFVDKFRRGIGGVSMHHNYIGGLAEHTRNVMQLTVMLCEKYQCRRTEIAVLAAKLHDIGKIYEYDYEGPFKYSLRGEMEGHIVIGVELIDAALRESPEIYSEDFSTRIKGCVVQHHGKLEFGSPREMKMEEAFIINYADSIDATMNKISQLKETTEVGYWSEYDRRIETRLYL